VQDSPSAAACVRSTESKQASASFAVRADPLPPVLSEPPAPGPGAEAEGEGEGDAVGAEGSSGPGVGPALDARSSAASSTFGCKT
jgi:hypothetical protein